MKNQTSEKTRPSWPSIWMSFAESVARRSYDPRLQVGSIIVTEDNSQVLSIGYNGNYSGGPHEHESCEPGQSGFIHAEVNCLIKCDYNTLKKKHMYITHSPCKDCCKLIINAKIEKVVYRYLYRDASGLQLLRDAGIIVRSIDEE